jgi:hypothetical protein
MRDVRRRLIGRGVLVLALFVAVAVAACGDPNVAPAAALPAAVTNIGISSASIQAGATVPDTLIALVVNGTASPIVGDTVIWAIAFGTGTLGATSSVTDTAGKARVTFLPATDKRKTTVSAAVRGLFTPAYWTVTVTAAAAATMAKVSGDNQSAAAGLALAAPLVVFVGDQYGNPVLGASVAWTFTGVGTLGNTVSVTDSTGHTSTTFNLGTGAGQRGVMATVTGIPPVLFTETGS